MATLKSTNKYLNINIMTVDLRKCFQANNPSKTIAAAFGLTILAVIACQVQALSGDSFANAVEAPQTLRNHWQTSNVANSAFQAVEKLKQGEGIASKQIMTIASRQPEPKTLTGHSDLVVGVAVSADGKTIASASYDKTIKLWDATTGKLIKTLNHRYMVYGLALNANGKTLASASGNEIVIWDVSSGKPLKTLTSQDGLWSVTWSPDGKKIASGNWDKTIKIWDANTGKLIKTLAGHKSEVYNVAWSPDSKILASTSGDNTIKCL
jgi:COMPASS component SWD3